MVFRESGDLSHDNVSQLITEEFTAFAYEVVAMVITPLLSDAYLHFVITCRTRSVEEFLWMKLTSLEEVVIGPLHCSHIYVSRLLNEGTITANIVDENMDGV
jgi:hypothetical protein